MLRLPPQVLGYLGTFLSTPDHQRFIVNRVLQKAMLLHASYGPIVHVTNGCKFVLGPTTENMIGPQTRELRLSFSERVHDHRAQQTPLAGLSNLLQKAQLKTNKVQKLDITSWRTCQASILCIKNLWMDVTKQAFASCDDAKVSSIPELAIRNLRFLDFEFPPYAMPQMLHSKMTFERLIDPTNFNLDEREQPPLHAIASNTTEVVCEGFYLDMLSFNVPPGITSLTWINPKRKPVTPRLSGIAPRLIFALEESTMEHAQFQNVPSFAAALCLVSELSCAPRLATLHLQSSETAERVPGCLATLFVALMRDKYPSKAGWHSIKECKITMVVNSTAAEVQRTQCIPRTLESIKLKQMAGLYQNWPPKLQCINWTIAPEGTEAVSGTLHRSAFA